MMPLAATGHQPVMLREAIEALRVTPGGRYIDATLGGGGHASAILEASAPGGQLLGVDVDPEAIALAEARLRPYAPAALLVQENFRHLAAICAPLEFRPVHGVLFDLGLSSMQLEGEGRGFSFQDDDPLDMRFDPTQGPTAADIVNTAPVEELERIIRDYGQEPRYRQIARAIVASRPLRTTRHLASVVTQAGNGHFGRIHPATRTFQALRIAVNRELENLEEALGHVPELLGYGGRLVVISYHSLEDTIVKTFLHRESRDCLCPPQVPRCICGHTATLRVITKKVIRPSLAEVVANPRSRSARMRVAERL